jgi:hypothetical protein
MGNAAMKKAVDNGLIPNGVTSAQRSLLDEVLQAALDSESIIFNPSHEAGAFNIIAEYRNDPGMVLMMIRSATPCTLSQDQADAALVLITALLNQKHQAHMGNVYEALRSKPELEEFAEAMRTACLPQSKMDK